MRKVNITFKHKEYSTYILNEVRNDIREIEELQKIDDLCLFAAGAFARNEATLKSSGIDMFYLRSGSNEKNLIDLGSKKIIDAQLSNSVKKANLLPLIDDEETLKVVYIEDLLANTATKREDNQGDFYIRMLFLLESQFLYNKELYNNMAKQMIHFYFNEFDAHIENFNAAYLINDIVKFWKIYSFNYERKKSGDVNYGLNNEELLYKNLKMEFSRKLTCYSFILQILLEPKTEIEDRLFSVFKMTTLKRVESLAERRPDLEPKINEILDLYYWYLDLSDLPFNEIYEYLKDKNNVKEAFGKGAIFSQKIFELMLLLTKDSPDVLKHLFI